MLPKLKAAGHRVLLFSQMVELMDFLEQFFLMRGFKYLRLDGNTSSDEVRLSHRNTLFKIVVFIILPIDCGTERKENVHVQ